MKKINKFLTLALGLGLLGGALVGASSKKAESAEALDYQTYVPLRDGWIENTDGSAVTDLNEAIRARNDRFWNGNPDPIEFDSQERSFNALDEFIDTIHRANGGEGWRGAYRTPELVLHDNDHRYVSFLFGGGAGDIFINIFQVTGAAGSGNRIEGIRTAFDGRGTFDNNNPERLNAPISCNMVFKYYRLPDEIQPGDHFLIYVRDGKTGDYGGFTFGDVHINQTLEDCARSFSAHKAQMKANEFMSGWTQVANEFVLNFYATDEFYADVRTAEAALTDANDDFEDNLRLSNWAYDNGNSNANVNFTAIYSDRDYKDWNQKMPANKTNNLYLNADTSEIPEESKYKIISNEFTLSGTGLVSVKMGGNSSKIELLNANTLAVLDGVENPNFVEGDDNNIVESGARKNTMTRLYIDWSQYLGQRVRIALSDCREGGNWGLAYFDELITRYNTYPGFKVDLITHEWADHGPYNGYILDTFDSRGRESALAEAYSFLQTYYSSLRAPANQFDYAVASESTKVNIVKAYKALSADAKAIVDNSKDIEMSGSEEDWWLNSFTTSNPISTAFASLIENFSTYTVSFSANGGSGDMDDDEDVRGVYELPECKFEAPEHQEFAGWKVKETDETLQPGETINVSQNVHLIAQWVYITHQITFSPGEGSGTMSPTEENEGSHYVLPASSFTAPDHKEFAGWKVNGVGDTLPVGESIEVEDDTELVAQWAQLYSTVTFSAGGGSGTMSPTQVPEGGLYTLPGNEFTAPEGQQFIGWKVNGIGETLTAGKLITVSSDVTLVAQWEDIPEDPFVITFNGNGGKGSMEDVAKADGDSYELPSCGFTAPDHTEFGGWLVGDTVKQPGDVIVITGNIEIKAVWNDIMVQVTFVGNGAEGSMPAEEVKEGSSYSLPACTFTAPENEEFVGWKVNGAGDTLLVGQSIVVNNNTELVAQWALVKHTVSLVADNGVDADLSAEVEHGDNFTLPECGFTAPENKEFAGWKVGSEEELKQPGETVVVNGNLVITAVWKLVKHTVTLEANNGSEQSLVVQVEHGSSYTLPECTFAAPEGKRFAGWKVNGEGELLQAGEQIVVNGNVRLVAEWENIPVTTFTVSFNANGGSGSMSSVTINEGEQFELPICSFVAPNGQEFAGWTVGETLYQPGEKLTVTADVVVNATWKDVQEVEPEVEPQTEPEVEPKPEEPAKEEEEQSGAAESVNKLKDIIKQIFDAILNFFRSLFAGSAE